MKVSLPLHPEIDSTYQLKRSSLERWDMLMRARNGGSITPRYRKVLDTHIAHGRISLHKHTTIGSLDWDQSSSTWTDVKTNAGLDLPAIDYIVFATGVQSDVEHIPYLRHIQQTHPVEVVGGVPCLNDDLMWCDDVPLFVTGRLAGLRLGPGAPNLVGARVGAERIAWNVADILQKERTPESLNGSSENAGSNEDDKFIDFVAGRRNRFDCLRSCGE